MELPNVILIEQRKEWGEIIWHFEHKNFYEVLDSKGKVLLNVIETGGRGTRRAWQSHALRPFEFQIVNPKNEEVIFTIKAPIRLFWYSVNILGAKSKLISTVTRNLSLLGRCFNIKGSKNGFIRGFWFYWKYKLHLDGLNECKMIRKWNGFFRIFLFGASRFKLEFKESTTQENRLFLLACAFMPEMRFHDPNR